MEWKSEYIKALVPIYGEREAESITNLVFEAIVRSNAIHPEKSPQFDDAMAASLGEALGRLSKNEPVQYVLGKAYFYDYEFLVDKRVLIPRSETEELVDWIIKSHQHHIGMKILDIGTGSGCISIVLDHKLYKPRTYTIDVSQDALDLAEINALRLASDVNFFQVDILKERSFTPNPELEFNIIVSNPPYVLESEKKEMAKNVLDYEPFTALFVEDSNPLVFYKVIAELASKQLVHNGFLYFETNESNADEVAAFMKSLGFINIEIKKDLNNKDRFVRGQRIVVSSSDETPE